MLEPLEPPCLLRLTTFGVQSPVSTFCYNIFELFHSSMVSLKMLPFPGVRTVQAPLHAQALIAELKVTVLRGISSSTMVPRSCRPHLAGCPTWRFLGLPTYAIGESSPLSLCHSHKWHQSRIVRGKCYMAWISEKM